VCLKFRVDSNDLQNVIFRSLVFDRVNPIYYAQYMFVANSKHDNVIYERRKYEIYSVNKNG